MIQCPFCFAIPTNKKFFSCKNRWERFCQAIKLQILFCHCLIFFFFSSVTRSASTATAAWQVFCLWSLQRFQQGLNVHRWKLFSIWNLIFFNCTNYTSSLISGWLWLHESSVSKSGDWRDDPELWARGDNAPIFNYQHLTPEIFDQCCSPKQVNCKYYHDGCMVTGLRSTMEEHEERHAHQNMMKIISIAAKWYNRYYVYIIYHYYRYYTLKVRLSRSALSQFRVSIKAPAQVVEEQSCVDQSEDNVL